MHFSFDIRLMYGPGTRQEIDPRLFELLDRIQTGVSLRAAANDSGLSYRFSWGLIKHWESVFATPLVILERGRGKIARLTEFGARLLLSRQALGKRTAREFEELAADLNNSLADYLHPNNRKLIRLFASHGMEVTYLHELLVKSGKLDIDLQIHGSIESLHSLNHERCQIAGFHLPLNHVTEKVAFEYKRWLIPDNHLLFKVASREQGIILQRGNPHKIHGLRDLERSEIVFINRQRQSGTRTILDELLSQEGVNPANINGYSNEEFTHLAVAAMISSGAVDAGFGIQAAAEKFNLEFIPYLTEIYILAIQKSLGTDITDEIIKKLSSTTFRRKINSLAGYSARESGKELSLHEILGDNHD